MFIRRCRSCLFGSVAFATNDPFLGKWKYESTKAKVAGLITKFRDAGNGKVRLITDHDVDTLVVDGKYHLASN